MKEYNLLFLYFFNVHYFTHWVKCSVPLEERMNASYEVKVSFWDNFFFLSVKGSKTLWSAHRLMVVHLGGWGVEGLNRSEALFDFSSKWLVKSKSCNWKKVVFLFCFVFNKKKKEQESSLVSVHGKKNLLSCAVVKLGGYERCKMELCRISY